jgi:Xaa-Pro aminopeptidase
MNLFPTATYGNRRTELAKNVRQGIILLPGNNDAPMNFRDNIYPFRQDSSFLYYAGLQRPGLALLIDCETNESILFGNDASIDEIIWTGPTNSVKSLAERVGIKKAMPFHQLQEKLLEAQHKDRPIHYLNPYRDDHKILLSTLLSIPVNALEEQCSDTLVTAIANQRLFKTEEETEEIEKAVNITGEMHLAAMRMAQIGMREQEIVSRLLEIATSNGGFYSFPPIVTIHGETLHNHYYGNILKKGDLLLVDAGAETDMGYAGDMTRTFPVGQKFTETQKAFYEIVLMAHQEAIDALKPGIPFRDVHLIASRKLAEGLKAMNLMHGNMEEAVNAGVHAMFFQCGLGHLMGLDVHDMENLGEEKVGYADGISKSTQFGLKSLRLGRKLQEGFVLTVEPGIYIIPALIDLWKSENKFSEFINYNELEKFRNFGGIRIEEDFVITEKGCRRLGLEVPKSIEDVEETISL